PAHRALHSFPTTTLFRSSRSGAFTPSDAPSFYRFSITLPTLLDNGRQYLDRTATFTIVMLIGWAAISGARRAELDRRTRSALVLDRKSTRLNSSHSQTSY